MRFSSFFFGALIVGAGYMAFKAMKPRALEGADLSRPMTDLVPYAPDTAPATAFGSGAVWRSATQKTYDPYASRVAWAPGSNGYGWDGSWYPVNAR